MRKTGHYRRASQVSGDQLDIRSALDGCRDAYPENAYPIFNLKNEVDAIIASHVTREDMDFLHVVTFEEGAGAAVIETLLRTGVNEEPAPEAKQYIQSQLYILCRRNDVVFTTHNTPMRDASVSVLVNKLIEHYSELETKPAYLLTATLDEERFRELINDGIEEIDLDVGAYRSTLEYLSNNGQIKQAGLFSVLKSFLTDDVTDDEREAAEKIMARLTLRPGRDWKDANVKELLGDMASTLLDNEVDSGFAIVTKSGLRITRDSVRVRDDFSVDGNRRIVDVVQVRTGLVEAFREFERLGVLDR